MTVDKGNFSTDKSKETRPQKLPKSSRVNSCLVQAKGGFWGMLCAYNEIRGVNLKVCLSALVPLIQKLGKTITTQLLNRINQFRATEAKIYPLSFIIRFLKNHLSLAQGENSPHWFQDNIATVFVVIYQLREFPLSTVVNRFELRYQLQQLLLLYRVSK